MIRLYFNTICAKKIIINNGLFRDFVTASVYLFFLNLEGLHSRPSLFATRRHFLQIYSDLIPSARPPYLSIERPTLWQGETANLHTKIFARSYSNFKIATTLWFLEGIPVT